MPGKYLLFLSVFLATLLFQVFGFIFGYVGPDNSYDKLIHFLLPASGAPLLYVLLNRWRLLISPSQAGAVLAIVLIGVTAEALWEIFEFVLDKTTAISWQNSVSGTIFDIMMAFLGSFTGGLLFTVWKSKGLR